MKPGLTRREFVRTASASGALLAAGTWNAASAQPGPTRQPNLLFICTDDQAPWALGRSGNADAYTPNLDRLFGEGAYLTHSFVVTPVCSPSRAATMSSRYGSEVGITDWLNHRLDAEANMGLASEYVTWAELLRDAGYATGLVGKWHLGTAPQFHPTKQGFQYYAGFLTGGTQPKDPELEVDGQMKPHTGLTVDILTDYAIGFLKRDHGEAPFALSLQYRSPHAPYLPVADEDMAHFEGKKLAIPNPDYPDLDVARVEQLMRQYLANIAGIDRNVGRVLAALEASGHAENTIVVFTSDHGYNIGQHGVLHKGNARYITKSTAESRGVIESNARPNMFDTSLLTPTGIRWPGVIPPGMVLDKTVSNLDWFPTFLDMAGVNLPSDLTIRGKSIVPLLRGKKIAWDNNLYGEYSQHHYVETHLRMYRTPEWKLVLDFKRPGHDELYHLAEDPNETTNLIDAPEAQEVRRTLRAKILERMRALHDPVADLVG